MNLAVRGVLGVENSRSCILCGLRGETEVHLFLHCEEVQRVWKKLMCWLHYYFIVPNNLLVHLECWSKEVSSKKLRQCFWLTWNVGDFEGEERVNFEVISWT